MDNNSVPISRSQLLRAFDEIKPVKEENVEDLRDKAISNLALTPGWKHLKEIIMSQVEELNNINIADDDTPEIIGFRYLASRVAKSYLEGILQLVEMTHDTISNTESNTE